MTAPAWNVEWKSISTPGQLLLLMLTQLAPQVAIAIKAGRSLLDAQGETTQHVSALLFSASAAADFLWPSPMRERNRSGIAQAFPGRARDIRHVLGVPDDEPQDLDFIRNDLTHADERLEEIYLADPDASVLAWGDGSAAPDTTYRFMNWSHETGVLHSLGHEIDVRALVDWLEELEGRLSVTFMPLMLIAHDLPITNTEEGE